MKTVTIIGCGIIGAMLAYELSKTELKVTAKRPSPFFLARGPWAAIRAISWKQRGPRGNGRIAATVSLCRSVYGKAYTAPTWHPDLTNKNGLPEGKPLYCLVAGTGFEPVTFGL